MDDDDYRIDGFALVGDVDPGELETARAITTASLQPCPADIVDREVTRLRMATIREKGLSQDDLVLSAAVYCEELAPYPEDVVIAVCRERRRFWPPLADLVEAAERLMRERRQLYDAIERGPVKPRAPDPEDIWRRKAIAERDRQWAEALAWRRANPDWRSPRSWRRLPDLDAERRRLPDLRVELAAFSKRLAAIAAERDEAP